jgi:hypothetical protein
MRTSGLSKYLNAANKLCLTDCATLQHNTTVSVSKITHSGNAGTQHHEWSFTYIDLAESARDKARAATNPLKLVYFPWILRNTLLTLGVIGH